MNSIHHLIALADAYKVAAGIDRDQTVSYRVFGDSKKLASLRSGAGITLRRFNAAVDWFKENWPAGQPVPFDLQLSHPPAHGPASLTPQYFDVAG